MFEIEEDKILAGMKKEGLLDDEQIDKARKSGTHPLHDAVIELGLLSKDQVYDYISRFLGVAYIDLANYTLEKEVVSLIPEELVRKFLVVPVYALSNNLGLAMADPRNVEAIDQVRLQTGLSVDTFLSAEQDIRKVLASRYQQLGSVEDMLEGLEVTRLKEEQDEVPELKDLSDEAPITKLVNLIFAQAVRDRASDIHIEPGDKILRIRFRIDGVLYEVPSPPPHLKSAITSRIKVMSNLNIAETRRTQDGHIRLRVEGTDIDVRVSILPTVFGENVVLRVLNPKNIAVGLEQLGFSETALRQFKNILSRPHGVLLNTGPTGSGKTTTLYAALQTLNSIDKNIITVEDPVEYRLKLIRQVQVNAKIGISFANGLRAILRQDPDIIMIGEIRDQETAEIAVQAALTGHFVLSTLHTNDAPGALPRLMDMGVEPFLAAASIEGVMAQRLVRKICPKCRESFQPSPLILEQIGLDSKKKYEFFRGKGCDACRRTGFKGRIACFELMDMTSAIKNLTIAKAPVDEIREKAIQEGMVLLKDDALNKVLEGVTTLEEMVRVTGTNIDLGEALPRKKVEEVGEEEITVGMELPEEETAPLKEGDLDDYQKNLTHWLARKT